MTLIPRTKTRAERIEDALLVMILNPRLRAYIKANDPKALEQAVEALNHESDALLNTAKAGMKL